jgi:hypothetical protein
MGAWIALSYRRHDTGIVLFEAMQTAFDLAGCGELIADSTGSLVICSWAW